MLDKLGLLELKINNIASSLIIFRRELTSTEIKNNGVGLLFYN